MNNNSNQVGVLLLIAIMLGAAVASFMFFGSEMEQQNVSTSFGQFSKSASSKSSFGTAKSLATDLSVLQTRSDLSGVILPINKMKSTSGGNYTQYTNPDFNSMSVLQVDVQNMNNSPSVAKTNTNVHYASNYSQSFLIANSNVEYINNSQNPTKADISGLLLLDTRAAESAMTTQQGSKRATPALASKTASVSTSLAGKGLQKLDGEGGAGDPGLGGSLPIGDGVWILLAFAGVFASNRFFCSLTR